MFQLVSMNLYATYPKNLKLNKYDEIYTTLKYSKLFKFPILNHTPATVLVSSSPFVDFKCEINGVLKGKSIITFEAKEMICFSDHQQYKSFLNAEGTASFLPSDNKIQHLKKGHVIMMHVKKPNSVAIAGVRG